MIVSVVRPALESFSPLAEGGPLNGATLSDARSLRVLANAEGVEALEAFLPPRDMVPVERLAALADSILEPRNRGRGRLRFHSLHNLPEVWADGAPRLLYCQDLYLLARERYLRDRFARGPMPVVSDVHCLGHRDIWNAFRELAAMGPVPYDRIVATSRSLAAGIEASFAALDAPPPMPVARMPRAIDIETLRPTGEEGKRLARRALRLPEKGSLTLYLGRLTPNDKADLLPLIDAFADVAEGDDLLLIAGVENVSGYAHALRERAAARRARVEVRSEVPRGTQALVFAAADLFAFPGDTVQEAIPTVVAEAMACGLPVVAADWDGARDLVDHGKTGLLVPTISIPPPGEVESLFPASDFSTDFLAMGQSVWVDRVALGAALGELLRDPARRARMGLEGRRFAEEHLALSDWTTRIVELGLRLIAEAAAAGPEEATVRRTKAERSSLAMPFGRVFAGYASRAACDEDSLALTAEGRRVLAGAEPPAFYDACLPYLTPLLIPAALRALSGGATLGEARNRIAAETNVSQDRSRFVLALLLKRGYATIVQG